MDPNGRIVFAERFADNVFIEFADGQTALYPASFLREHLPRYKYTSHAEDSSQDPPERGQ